MGLLGGGGTRHPRQVCPPVLLCWEMQLWHNVAVPGCSAAAHSTCRHNPCWGSLVSLPGSPAPYKPSLGTHTFSGALAAALGSCTFLSLAFSGLAHGVALGTTVFHSFCCLCFGDGVSRDLGWLRGVLCGLVLVLGYVVVKAVAMLLLLTWMLA